MAAQAEIPPAIVVKNNAAAAVTSDTASTAATTSEAATSPTESTTTATESVTVAAAAPVETPARSRSELVATEPVVTEPEPDIPSLSDFLAQLRCGGRGKNCSPREPRRGVGNQKAPAGRSRICCKLQLKKQATQQ